MKFYELIALYKDDIASAKKENIDKPSLKYIMMAYANVLKQLTDTYSDNEAVTDKKLVTLDITKHMYDKLVAMSKKNIPVRMSEKMKNERKINALKLDLTNLIGIGEKAVNELILAGLTNINQLHKKKWFDMLNLDTKAIITHNPIREIEYDTIKQIEPKLTSYDKSIMLVGSYRRKKPIMRDIDILFMPNGTKTITGYLTYLKKTFGNRIWIYAHGSDKVSMIIQPDTCVNKDCEKCDKFKTDIFIADPSNYYPMLLYTTGSKAHNIKMRSRAKHLGLLLNQNGIFKNGKLITSEKDTEKKLFSLLDMTYVEPEKRF